MFRRGWIATLVVIAAGAGTVGCFGGGGSTEPEIIVDEMVPAALDEAEAIWSLARLGSGWMPHYLAFMYVSWLDQEPGCPTVEIEGDTIVLTGGCTDESGHTYSGRMEGERAGSGYGFVVLEDWRVDYVTECDGEEVQVSEVVNGSATFTRTATGDTLFSVDVLHTRTGPGEGSAVAGFLPEDRHNCDLAVFELDLQYIGESIVVSDFSLTEAPVTVINGSGEIGFSPVGVATVFTEGYVVDDELCESEAAAGQTILWSDYHMAEITYDGSVDCDPQSTVSWRYDDVAMGELQDFGTCSVGRLVGQSPTGMVALLGVMALVVGLRRRGRA